MFASVVVRIEKEINNNTISISKLKSGTRYLVRRRTLARYRGGGEDQGTGDPGPLPSSAGTSAY